MNPLFTLLVGIVAGTYFAEEIRKTIPVLDPSPTTVTTTTATSNA